MTTHSLRPLLRRAAPLALVLATACSGPLLYAELEVPEVGVTIAQQSFPASSADPSFWCSPDQATAEECLVTELSYDLGEEVELLTEDDVDYDLRLTGLGLQLAASETGDLGGVRRVEIFAVPPGGGAPVLVAAYARVDGAEPPARVEVSGNSNLDLAPYLDSGKITLRVEMSVDGATPAFTADVMAVFYVRVRLDYGASLGI